MFGLSLTFAGVTANYTENGEVLAMTAITFDTLGYFQKLKAAGVPEEQAQIQADALRLQSEAQAAALQKALDKYDAVSRKDLATRGNIQDVRVELQDVRTELKQDIQDVRLEMKSMEMRLLKWQIGLAAAIGSFMLAGFGTLAAVMAKGFGWLGF